MMTQPMAVYAGVSALAAFVISACLTAILCKVAPRWGLLDYPDPRRKLHARPTPVGGGVAIFLSLCLVLAANFALPNPWGFRVAQDWWDVITLLAAAGWLMLVGLWDDRFGLRGRYKLVAQLLAACVVVGGGYSFTRLNFFGLSVDLGEFGPIVAVLWFLGTINSINLLDGMDGQAASLGVIFSVSIAIMACLTGHFAVAFIAILLAAATLGFLLFNLPPAKIFLGDAGSMFIGLMLGVLAVRASLKGPSTLLVGSVLLLWFLPMLDTVAAIVRRRLTGRSIYSTDRLHIHHRFSERLGSNVRALWVIIALAFLTSCFAVGSLLVGSDLFALGAAMGVLVGLVTTGLFGRAECRLALAAVRRVLGRGLASLFSPERKTVCEGLQLSGRGSWDDLWKQLLDPADQYNVVYARIDLNDDRSRESYIGEWRTARPICHEEQPVSSHCVPLWVDNRPVGRIEAILLRCAETFQRDVEFVLSLADPFESRLRELGRRREIADTVIEHLDSTTVMRVGPDVPSALRHGNGNGRKELASKSDEILPRSQ